MKSHPLSCVNFARRAVYARLAQSERGNTEAHSISPKAATPETSKPTPSLTDPLTPCAMATSWYPSHPAKTLAIYKILISGMLDFFLFPYLLVNLEAVAKYWQY